MITPKVVGLGALNVDRILLTSRILADGETAVEDAGVFPGGSAANTIYGLARLNIATGFCGAVGADAEGRLLLRSFKKAGVDTRIIVKKGATSGTVFGVSTPRRRALYVLPGANAALTASDIDMDYVNNADYLHISSFVDDAQFELSQGILKKLAPQVKMSFAPGALYAARGMAALRTFLKCTEVLFINRSELETLTSEDFRAGCAACIRAGCRSVAVTLGAGFKHDGQKMVAYVRDETTEWYIDGGRADRLDVADTTGAGDAFAAGYLFGRITGKSPPDCGRLGNCTARLSLGASGARSGLPTRLQLERCYSETYEK
ncbi:MAG: carbohydrate kinase family protein [Dehalococcoidia bacterium]|nr:carbohydrate kinase family protein [Dehalococcoidia bacterium]